MLQHYRFQLIALKPIEIQPLLDPKEDVKITKYQVKTVKKEDY